MISRRVNVRDPEAKMAFFLSSLCLVALHTPPLTSRRQAALSGAAAALLPGVGGGSIGSAAAADPPYRVAMTVLLDPQKQSRGELVIEVLPEWAPLAASRFKELVELGFYKRTRFHRVLQGFLPGDLSIAQFGISTSRELNTEWLCKTCKPLPDEVRSQPYAKGDLYPDPDPKPHPHPHPHPHPSPSPSPSPGAEAVERQGDAFVRAGEPEEHAADPNLHQPCGQRWGPQLPRWALPARPGVYALRAGRRRHGASAEAAWRGIGE